MKCIKGLVLILTIVLLFSSCCSDDPPENGQPGFSNPIETSYCGYYLSTHSQWKNLLKGVDRDIIFVPCGEKAEDFFERLEGYEEIELTDTHGNALSDDRTLATGHLINSKGYGDFYIVVIGDIDGDGKITSDDALIAEKFANGEQKASAIPYVMAADIDASGTVDGTDVDLINYGTNSESQGLAWYYEMKVLSRTPKIAYEEYSLLLG